MARFAFQYHRVNDFPSGIDMGQLHDEVKAALPTLQSINMGEDIDGAQDQNGVIISFSAAVVKATLDGLVAAHTGVPADLRPVVNGSRADTESAFKRLLEVLDAEGIIKNSTGV